MNIKIMLWYDVEDYITPEADEALLGLIRMMDGRGVRSSLKIVGEKARALQRRGRLDILSLLPRHEICYHTDFHSKPPTMSEYLEHCGFADGALEFERREAQGLADLKEITGQMATSYGQPGASWAPQVFPVLRKWGIPTYVDSHWLLNVDNGPFFYGGILCLTRLWSTMRMDLKPDGLERAKAQFDEIIARMQNQPGDTGLISIYYHPCEFSCTQFWDGVNYPRGKDTPRDKWRASPLHPAGYMEQLIEQLGRFIDYTLTKPDVEYITALEAAQYVKKSPKAMTAERLARIASGVGDGVDYLVDGDLSLCASELLSLFGRKLAGLPLTPELYYGPERDVPSVGDTVRVGDMAAALRQTFPKVMGYPMLPNTFQVGAARLNPCDMFVTAAAAIAQGLGPDDTLPVGHGTLLPVRHVNENYKWGSDWVIFPEDFDGPNLVRMAKLQTWTMKPALY
nr:hypothetical protein [bacterium]